MDALGNIHAWLTWEEELEGNLSLVTAKNTGIPEIKIPLIPGLAIAVSLFAPSAGFHSAIACNYYSSIEYFDIITDTYIPIKRESRRREKKVRGREATLSSRYPQIGQRGEKVRKIQKQLNNLGFVNSLGSPIKEDGIFGLETRAAVINFQKSQRLKADAIVGTKTAEALQKSQSLKADAIGEPQTAEFWKNLSDVFSISQLKVAYEIPQLKEFKKLEYTLKNGKEKDQYKAAVELAYIWHSQKERKNGISNEVGINKIINFYDPRNLAIVVSVNNANKKYPKQLKAENLPVDLLLSVFDKAIEKAERLQPDIKKQPQFIMAVLRTDLMQPPTDKVIDILSKNLIDDESDKLDLFFKEDDTSMSVAQAASYSLEIISNYYPKELARYLKNHSEVYEKIQSKNPAILINLAKSDDSSSLKRIKALISQKQNSELNQASEFVLDLVSKKLNIYQDKELKDKVVEVLKTYLEDPENKYKKVEAASALATIDQNEGKKYLKQYLTDPSKKIEAVSALATIDQNEGKKYIQALKKYLVDPNNNDTEKAPVASALIKLGTEGDQELQTEVIEALIKNAKPLNEQLISNADQEFFLNISSELCILANIGEPAIKYLDQVSQRSNNPQIKKQIKMIKFYIKNPSVNYPLFITLCTTPGGERGGFSREVANYGVQVIEKVKNESQQANQNPPSPNNNQQRKNPPSPNNNQQRN